MPILVTKKHPDLLQKLACLVGFVKENGGYRVNYLAWVTTCYFIDTMLAKAERII
jgi:hypothetical protein